MLFNFRSDFKTLSLIMSTIFSTIVFELWFRFPYFMDDSVETVNFICFVFDYACSSVSFFKRVAAFYFIPITFFVLLFFVAGVGVVDGVVEFVFCWFLKTTFIVLTKLLFFIIIFPGIQQLKLLALSSIFTAEL